MAFRSPPEVLLRHALKIQRARSLLVTRLALAMTSAPASTYRAAMVTDTKKPMVIQHLDRRIDVPENYVRVAIHHCGINFADILLSQGKYQEKPPLPFTPGSEFAGRVTELGTGVTNVTVGSLVSGISPVLSGCSEEIVLPALNVSTIPPKMSTEVASAITCVYGTAWLALTRRAQIKRGEIVLVTSAAGGVGLAAVDLAANIFGAKVIAACGSDEKCAIAEKRGAYATVNYTTQKLNERVKELTGGHGADIIVDNVGGDIFNACLRCIAFEGRILCIGFASGVIPKIPANILLVKSCTVMSVYWGSYRHKHPESFGESVQGVMDAYTQGKIKPHISKVLPLTQINEAYQYILDRKSTGKVVIDCRN